MGAVVDKATKVDNGQVPEQTDISWAIAFRVSLAGVRRRFGRSMITMTGVVLAIAFLSYMLATESIINALVNLNDDQLNTRLQQMGINIFRGVKTEPMTLLLLGLTLLTCMVGITNSMLMAVTERVREIGTLKCLGARDEFILKTYFIESSLHGICGAVIGLVLGLLVAISVCAYNYGHQTLLSLPVLSLAGNLTVSLLIGAVMTVTASLFPAYVAARKQPVEALRVEE
jgi:putative ABC transport system permease protein